MTQLADTQTSTAKAGMTLEQLLGMVRDTLAEVLCDTYWVIAEIASMRMNARGYCNFEIVQKSGETLIAKASAVAFQDTCRSVFPRFEQETGQSLRPGMSVLVRASITFHTAYGLSVRIHDIDPAYTLGDMARKRRETIDRLALEGLLDRNKALPFPLVPQRIAVLSSASAAGYEDFVHQIENNVFGYAFRHHLFPSLMQGNSAEGEVVAALKRASQRRDEFDLMVIIRGGGSLTDLGCFDGYDIAAAIGAFPLPVITGIGHERDETVADLTAHTRAKTPTAAAEHIVGTVRAFEDRIETLRAQVLLGAQRMLTSSRQRLDRSGAGLSRQALETCVRERTHLDHTHRDIADLARRGIDRQTHKIETLKTKVHLLDPINVLRRGYSITYAAGRLLRSAADASPGTALETRLADGAVISTVNGEAPALTPTPAAAAMPTSAVAAPAKRRTSKAKADDMALQLDL